MVAHVAILIALIQDPHATARLIARLGDGSIEDRHEVQSALVEIGASALIELRRVSTESPDCEVQGAATSVIGRIEAQRLSWQLVARASLIVRGVPGVPAEDAWRRSCSLVRIVAVAKGNSRDETITVDVWGSIPRELVGKECLIAIAQGEHVFPYVLAALPVTRWNVADAADEASRQEKLLAEFVDPKNAEWLDTLVVTLADQLATGAPAEWVVQELTALGPRAVPVIVRHLDDRRALHRHEVKMPDGPLAETREVIDVLILALRATTAEWCTTLGWCSDEARRQALQFWRLYVLKHIRA